MPSTKSVFFNKHCLSKRFSVETGTLPPFGCTTAPWNLQFFHILIDLLPNRLVSRDNSPIYPGAWLIDLDHGTKLGRLKCVLEIHETPHNLSFLQIGLAIQIARVDVRYALRIAASQKQQISRYEFVVREVNQVTDLHIFPRYLRIPVVLAIIT